MVTATEELKYLRLIKEGEFAKKDLSGESIDIEISEMDVSPPEQFTLCTRKQFQLQLTNGNIRIPS